MLIGDMVSYVGSSSNARSITAAIHVPLSREDMTPKDARGVMKAEQSSTARTATAAEGRNFIVDFVFLGIGSCRVLGGFPTCRVLICADVMTVALFIPTSTSGFVIPFSNVLN